MGPKNDIGAGSAVGCCLSSGGGRLQADRLPADRVGELVQDCNAVCGGRELSPAHYAGSSSHAY